jgi:hypothetical protein
MYAGLTSLRSAVTNIEVVACLTPQLTFDKAAVEISHASVNPSAGLQFDAVGGNTQTPYMGVFIKKVDS